MGTGEIAGVSALRCLIFQKATAVLVDALSRPSMALIIKGIAYDLQLTHACRKSGLNSNFSM